MLNVNGKCIDSHDVSSYMIRRHGIEKVGEGKDDNMKVKMSKGGRYKFRVTCHTKCKKTAVAQTTVKVLVIDPCDSVGK